ncbi:geraniol 8-hydroxylase-like [Magnolia sinica]|uniref:geraniol 8-hydroxylase-like n=1 Tax=Magnolia sinica TaxID=86752 RepID=UPI00265B243A|nr:geraniol 8-hydroxylase-like [Magnolia sinica]XP_058104710.1 geraniol 8-hydroxylase-like [Magnolia sinica]
MDYTSLLLWISLAWSCIHVVLLLSRKRPRRGNLPPGPIPLPIVGSLFKLGNRPNESLAYLAKLHGPLMTLKLGRVTTVVISSAKMAKEVLQKNDQAFAGRTVVDAVRVLHHDEASMVWSQPNPHWRNLRMMCNTHIFTTQRLDTSQGLRRQKVQELVAHVRENSRTGHAVDIGQAAFNTTLNLISNTVFSVDLVDPKSKSAQEFKDLVWRILEEAGKPNLSDYFPLLRSIDPQGIRRRSKDYFRKLHLLFDRKIDQRLPLRSSPDYCKRNDFLDVLLDHSHATDRHDIKALLTDIFVAGSDTTSTTLEWAMAELLRNPHTMAKARSEVIETIGSEQQVQESDISRLPYTQAVVKETLRLHPPVPLLIPHRAESDVEICGFTVPKHTQVLVNAWAIGRDDDAWTDPTSFVPERFLDSHVDFRGRDFELIPFGAGRRICPGLPLAYRMVHLMLASLLHSFAWKLPDGMSPQEMDMSDKFGVTLQMAVPLRAIPEQDNGCF